MYNVHVVHVRDVLVVKTVYTILEKEELGALRKEQKDKWHREQGKNPEKNVSKSVICFKSPLKTLQLTWG